MLKEDSRPISEPVGTVDAVIGGQSVGMSAEKCGCIHLRTLNRAKNSMDDVIGGGDDDEYEGDDEDFFVEDIKAIKEPNRISSVIEDYEVDRTLFSKTDVLKWKEKEKSCRNVIVRVTTNQRYCK